MTRRRSLVVFVVAALVATGCGGAAPEVAPVAPPEAPRPRDAALIAMGLCQGKVGVMVWNDRVRDTPLAPKLVALDVWRAVLEGTGVDPMKDIDRAFVTAPAARHGEKGVAVAEHHLDDAAAHAAIEVLVARSGPAGGWIEGLGAPTAKVVVKGMPRAIVLPRTGLLVVLPEELAAGAARFAKSGGLPDPTGDEAALASAVDPHATLRGTHVPEVPETVRDATATIRLGQDGSADVKLDAASASEEQARADAQVLTERVDAATTVRVSIIKVRFFEPIAFRADGDRVRADVHLAPAEVDKLIGLAQAFIPR